MRSRYEPSEPKPHAQLREARQTALASVSTHDRRHGALWRVVVRGDQWGVKARGSANSGAQQGLAPDCRQPSLVPRCGFRQQVKPGVRCQVRGGKTKESISEFRRSLEEQIRYTVGHIVHFLDIA